MPYSDPEEQRAYQRAWLASRREAWISEHGPCIDCGSHDDLEVDHADATTKVTHRVWSWSAARRAEELAKCVVRCVPCHDKKTLACREYLYGEASPSTHITEEIVRSIRASSDSERTLARRYKLGNSTVHRIKVGQAWKYLE